MIMNPTAIKHVVVDGHSLTLESFVAIARYNATVELAPSALEAMQKSRALAEKIAAEGRVAYGITTGFGEFQKVAVPKEMSNQLSTNLILSHCTAAGEIADASERRTERMVNPALSNGLTAFLTTQAGVNSGFMIVQYAAASMVSENKVYAHPASVDSIPSSANQEDIVSMGTTAARKAKMILQNTQDVLADELLTACQAIDIRRRLNTHGQGLTPLHEAIYQHVRKEVAFYEVDREIWPDIRAVEKMIRSGELLDIVKEYIPDFE